MTSVTVRIPMIRGVVKISKVEGEDNAYTAEANNFKPITFQAETLDQAIGMFTMSIGSMERTDEFKAKQALATARRKEEMKKNATKPGVKPHSPATAKAS